MCRLKNSIYFCRQKVRKESGCRYTGGNRLISDFLLIFKPYKNSSTMTTNTKEIYCCSACGHMVEVLHPGAIMQCCGNPMALLVANTTDGAQEKHVPIVTPVEGGYKVTVGCVEHPMSSEHHIEWIELVTPTEILRRELKPGEKSEVMFHTKSKSVTARAYCNLHGLWKSCSAVM